MHLNNKSDNFKLNIFTINKTFIQIYTVNHATFREEDISLDTSLYRFFFFALNTGHVYCTEHYETEKYG